MPNYHDGGEFMIEVSLRYTAYVPYWTDAVKWVNSHKAEIIGHMRMELAEPDRCKITFEDNWGDLVDFNIQRV